MIGGASELPRPWAEVTSCGDRVKDTPSSVATVVRSSVPDPVDLDTLLLQGEEHYKSGNRDGTRERGGGDAESERALRRVGQTGGEGVRTSYTLTTSQGIAS